MCDPDAASTESQHGEQGNSLQDDATYSQVFDAFTAVHYSQHVPCNI